MVMKTLEIKIKTRRIIPSVHLSHSSGSGMKISIPVQIALASAQNTPVSTLGRERTFQVPTL